MGEKIVSVLKSKMAKIVYGCIIFVVCMILSSFTAVKMSTKSEKSVKIATDIVGQLSDQYLAPKFDSINVQLEGIRTDVSYIKDEQKKQADKSYHELVRLIDKQYEKIQKNDKFDIKTVDLSEIDEDWPELPDKYKTELVKKEYSLAMDYYFSIKK
jgi:hypothetical protein